MNNLTLLNSRTLLKDIDDKVFQNDNKITVVKIKLPDSIGGYSRRRCNIELRAILPNGNYLSYAIDTSKEAPEWAITNDLTESVQTVKLMMVITHEGNVIGRTNAVELDVLAPAETVEPLTPREEFDTRIAELEGEVDTLTNENEGLENTIAEKSQTIMEKSAEISGLNTQVSELTTENTRLENLTDTQRETIQNMLDNPPQPKLYTPPEPIIPENETRVYTPPQNYDGFASFTVDRVTAEGVGFNPDYYKEDEECLGKVGTYNPFPEQSYGGIYYTKVDENNSPVEILYQNIKYEVPTDNILPITNSQFISSVKKLTYRNCANIIIPNIMFTRYSSLEYVDLQGIVAIRALYAFSDTATLKEVKLYNGLTTIASNSTCFSGNPTLKKINFPNTLVGIVSAYLFQNDSNLEFVEFENGFQLDGLNLSVSTLYSVETIVSWLEALADRTGQTAYTLTIGTTNLNKLTAEQRAIATNKNWNLA